MINTVSYKMFYLDSTDDISSSKFYINNVE